MNIGDVSKGARYHRKDNCLKMGFSTDNSAENLLKQIVILDRLYALVF